MMERNLPPYSDPQNQLDQMFNSGLNPDYLEAVTSARKWLKGWQIRKHGSTEGAAVSHVISLAYEAALRKLDRTSSKDIPNSIPKFYYKILHTTCLNFGKKTGTERQPDLPLEFAESVSEDWVYQEIETEDHRQVALARITKNLSLSNLELDILHSIFNDDYDKHEIAERLNVAPAKVQQKRDYLLRRIRKNSESYFD